MHLVTHFIFLLGLLTAAANAGVVSRNLADPASAVWAPGAWNTASLQVETSTDRPPENTANCDSLKLIAGYNGEGFQYGGFVPPSGKIPGVFQKVTVWLKPLTEGHSWALKFKDAQERDNVANKKLEKAPRLTAGKWQQIIFEIPAEWEQPVSFAGISAHNWSRKQEKVEAALLVHDLRVYTDTESVQDVNQLVSLNVDSGFERNIFTSQDTLAYKVTVDSWLGKTQNGTMASTITDMTGLTVASETQSITVGEAANLELPLAVTRFGIYRVAMKVALESGVSYEGASRFAYLPEPHALTPEQKQRSPWGLNIHGGIEGVAYHGIQRTGFTWVRDYAYAYDWMLKARGDNGKYAAWPWYPRMDAKLRDSGLMLLACLMHSMGNPVDQGIMAPNQEWKLNLLHILWAFPQYTAWEVDNEYDLKHRQEEAARDYRAYDAYHKLFGETVNFVEPDDWAVENGTAGIHPERVRQSIARGAFDNIDVVNAHFYCGTAAPEIAIRDKNTGSDNSPPSLVWDLMRELAEAADSDGKDRQAWITEFGWDTLAVHIVSEDEQAAYLQRGYLLGLQAGLDKMFWYWNLDTTNTPTNFFDGCGIFDPRREPKPAVASMAAMAHFLVAPEPVGTFDFGPNTMGHVFRDSGRLVACAFQLDKAQPSAAPSFQSGELFDMYGNALPEAPELLTLAPVWAVGIHEDDPIVKQASYDLATRRFLRSTAGDATTVQLRVRNWRQSPIRASYTVKAPAGWIVEPAEAEISVPAGETQLIPIRVSLPPAAQAIEDDVQITIHEGKISKHLGVRFMFLPAATISTQPLSSTPGADQLQVEVRNNSLEAHSYKLRLHLPASWRAPNLETLVKDLPSGESRSVTIPLTWNLDWRADERAEVAVLTTTGEELQVQGIRPGGLPVPGVGMNTIVLDGNLGEWPANSRLLDWALGGINATATAQIYLAHTTGGLYIGLHVPGSDGSAFNPKWFWNANALELFVDTANDKTPRSTYAATDHQYWFCPRPEAGKVYMGRWKRNQEIPETQYDIPGLQSGVSASKDGYTMEFLLPDDKLTAFTTAAGKALGMNLNLTILGTGANSMQTHEIYWPAPKSGTITQQPQRWGTLYLK